MGIIGVLENLSRTKVVDPVTSKTQLSRCLTTSDLAVMGLGAMLGSGVYVLTGVVVKEIAGPATILSYIIALLGSAMAAACYVEFASRLPVTGSAYTYTYVTIGEMWAFLIGWNLLLEYVVGTAAIARAWSGYFDELIDYRLSNFTKTVIFKDTPLNLPLLAAYPDPFSGLIVIIVILLVCLGAKISARCLHVLLTVNLCAMFIIFMSGIFLGNIKNWDNFFPFGASGVLTGAAMCFFACTGFDIITMSSEEAIDHVKSVPRATAFVYVITSIAYISISISITLIVPYDEISEEAPFSHAVATHGLIWARYIVGLGALCGVSTSLIACLFAASRTSYAMASDGLLFSSLANVWSRNQVPVVSAVGCGSLSTVMAVFFDLRSLVEFTSIGMLSAYAIVAGAVIVLRYRPIDIFSHGDEFPNTHSNCGDDHPPTGNTGSEKEHDSTVDIRGSLKPRFQTLAFLASREPGQVVSVCLLLAVILQTTAVVVGVTAWDSIAAGESWSVILLAILVVMVLVTLIPILMHNQTSDDLGFNVPFVPCLPIASIFVDIMLMATLKPLTLVRFAVWIAIGLLLYAMYGYHHSTQGQQRASFAGTHKYQIITNTQDSSALPLYGSVIPQKRRSYRPSLNHEEEETKN